LGNGKKKIPGSTGRKNEGAVENQMVSQFTSSTEVTVEPSAAASASGEPYWRSSAYPYGTLLQSHFSFWKKCDWLHHTDTLVAKKVCDNEAEDVRFWSHKALQHYFLRNVILYF